MSQRVPMDKSKKLALARKKLRKFQTKISHHPHASLPLESHEADDCDADKEWNGPASLQSDTVSKVVSATEEQQSNAQERAMISEEKHFEMIREKAASDLERSQKIMDALQSQYTKERSGLEEQVKAYSQTVDILVSEKTNLQEEVVNLRRQLGEVEETYGSCQLYLQSAKTKQEELEREREGLLDRLDQLTRQTQETSTVNTKYQNELVRMRLVVDESKMENEELVSKLRSKTDEVEKLRNHYTILQSSQPAGKERGSSKELQRMAEEKEKMKTTIQRLNVSRDELSDHLTSLQQQLEQQKLDYDSKLNESLCEQDELKEKLKMAESAVQHAESYQEEATAAKEKEIEDSHQNMADLEKEVDSLRGQLNQQLYHNKELVEVTSQLTSKCADLEMQLSRLSSESIDHKTLLETVHHDKEALSRAVAQNKELKAQLIELQDEFVKMSHKNMELASDLETEQYGRKKLMEASTTHGQQVSLLNEQIEVLRTELAKHRQAGDGREREEEADGSTEISKNGQETVDGLLTEEDTLMKQSLENVEAERDSLVHKLQTVLQEREDMGQQIQQLASEKDTLTEQLHSFSLHEEANESHDNHVTQDQILELSSNFTALQDRFTLVMSQNADLVDRLQEYEYITVQLEGENATIAEYIELYHNKRKALKEKIQEKDSFIDKLLKERSELEDKLAQIQQAAEAFVHPLHSPVVEGRQAEEDPSLQVQEDSSEMVTKETLRCVLEKLSPPVYTSTGHHGNLMVPCTCCSGEIINV